MPIISRSRGGGGGITDHKSIGFLSNTGPHPENSQSYQARIQSWSSIGTPAKRHLNGVSLVGRCWPASSGIWIPSSTKNCLTPFENISGSAHAHTRVITGSQCPGGKGYFHFFWLHRLTPVRLLLFTPKYDQICPRIIDILAYPSESKISILCLALIIKVCKGAKKFSTTPDLGYQWESDQFTVRHDNREPRGQPFPSR